MSPPILFVPGAFCGGWAFDAFRRPFEAAGHACAALNLVPAGRDPAGRSMADYAAAVAAAVRACPAPPVVIGHSLGGLVGRMAAARAPVAGLVLLAPSGGWGVVGQTLEEGASSLGLLGLGEVWARSVAPDWRLARRFGLDRLPPAEAREVFARMRRESGLALHQTLNWWLDPALTTLAAPIGVPALAIAGGQDRVHPPATVRQTALRLGARLEVFPELSHWLIGEPGWEQVADACVGWLGDLSLRPAA